MLTILVLDGLYGELKLVEVLDELGLGRPVGSSNKGVIRKAVSLRYR